ncbi:PEP-CTERM sorting domain-containing protein [Aquisalimonas asiatica]|uniref:PEP-CTERM protein-sorting domain-containing protein n=1 Tax=Aquisalimonas asiatica TaxID=406100 RepID=A0A1H8U5X5_9GAMM|nr:PEP-CTERM sorting domain-containing protein [Aquisalimonas asiatica]SEO98243.1 PEP-CTERM protein-sorting domain-containing protein [Aquisalimonas asiatica]
MQKFKQLGIGVLLSAALVLAPLTASGNFMSMSDEDMERYQNMFRTNAVDNGGDNTPIDDDLDNGGGSGGDDGNVSNPGGDNPNQVPEPGMLALFGIGALGLALMVRRRTQQ